MARASRTTYASLFLALAFLAGGFAGAQDTQAFTCDTILEGLPCNIDATGTGQGNELAVAMNPNDPGNVVIVAKDYALTGSAPACTANNVWAGYYTTLDGGETWVNGHVPGYPGGPSSPISGWICSTDPVVGVDNLGRFYYSGLAYSGSTFSTSGIWVARSTDGGLTWPEMSVADASNFNDKNWMAVDPENYHVYVTWTLFNSGSGIWFRRAMDGDISTWSPRIQLCSASCGSAQGSYPVVGPDGEVYVTWNNAISGGSGSIYMVKSTNFGASFTPEDAAVSIQATPWSDGNAYRTPTIHSFAVSRCDCPTRGHLYLVWQDKRNGDSDAYFARSTDGGDTWSAPQRINDDAQGNGRPQYFPAIDVDDTDGSLHVSWYDRRDDPGNYRLHAYYATSGDDGQTWSPNLRLSTVGSDPQYSEHQSGAVFIGDYLGIAAHDGIVRPVWTDTRHQRPDVFTVAFSVPPTLTGALSATNVVEEEIVDGALTVNAPLRLNDADVALTIPAGAELLDPGTGTPQPQPDGSTLLSWDLGAFKGIADLGFTVRPLYAGLLTFEATLDFVPREGEPGSLAWSENLLVAFPQPVLDLLAPARVLQGNLFQVTLSVSNPGSAPIDAAQVAVTFDPDVRAVPRSVSLDENNNPVYTYAKPGGESVSEPGNGAFQWDVGTVDSESARGVTLTFQAPRRQHGLLEVPSMQWGAALAAFGPGGIALGDMEGKTISLAPLWAPRASDATDGAAALLNHLSG